MDMHSSKGSNLRQFIATLGLHLKLRTILHTTHSIERKHLRLIKLLERNNLAIARRQASIAETEAILDKHDYPSGICRVDLQQVQAALEGLKEELWYMKWVSKSMEKDLVKIEAELDRRGKCEAITVAKIERLRTEHLRGSGRVEHVVWWADQRQFGDRLAPQRV
jgi:hypothetical protein